MADFWRWLRTEPLFVGWVVAVTGLFAFEQYRATIILTVGFAAWQLGHISGIKAGIDFGFRQHLLAIDAQLEDAEREIMARTAPDDPMRQEIARRRGEIQRAIRDGLQVGSHTDRNPDG